MDVLIEGRAAAFVERMVETGTSLSAPAVIEDALRQQEAKLAALRAKVEASDASGDTADAEIDEYLAVIAGDLEREGQDVAQRENNSTLA